MPSMKDYYQRRLERLRIKTSRRKAKAKAIRKAKQEKKALRSKLIRQLNKETDNQKRIAIMDRLSQL